MRAPRTTGQAPAARICGHPHSSVRAVGGGCPRPHVGGRRPHCGCCGCGFVPQPPQVATHLLGDLPTVKSASKAAKEVNVRVHCPAQRAVHSELLLLATEHSRKGEPRPRAHAYSLLVCKLVYVERGYHRVTVNIAAHGEAQACRGKGRWVPTAARRPLLQQRRGGAGRC